MKSKTIRAALAAMVAAVAILLSVASCRLTLIGAKLADPALAEFVAYRVGLDQLVIDEWSPIYPVGTVVRYTIDGSDPTEVSAALNPGATIESVAEGTELRVRAYLDGLDPSDIASAAVDALVQTLATPDLSYPVLLYYNGEIDIADTAYNSLYGGYPSGTVIYYTTDSSDPDETDDPMPDGGTISVWAPFTLKARAYCDGYLPSAIAVATDDDM